MEWTILGAKPVSCWSPIVCMHGSQAPCGGRTLAKHVDPGMDVAFRSLIFCFFFSLSSEASPFLGPVAGTTLERRWCVGFWKMTRAPRPRWWRVRVCWSRVPIRLAVSEIGVAVAEDGNRFLIDASGCIRFECGRRADSQTRLRLAVDGILRIGCLCSRLHLVVWPDTFGEWNAFIRRLRIFIGLINTPAVRSSSHREFSFR